MGLISYPLDNDGKERIRQFVEAFGELWPDSSYGPAHIVIADYNLLDDHLEFSRGLIRGMLKENATPEELEAVKDYDPHDPAELRATLLLFDILALIPEELRDVHDALTEEEDEGREAKAMRVQNKFDWIYRTLRAFSLSSKEEQMDAIHECPAYYAKFTAEQRELILLHLSTRAVVFERDETIRRVATASLNRIMAEEKAKPSITGLREVVR